jgi:predicted anti-sigma-YlaC factor YlaD
LGARAALRRNGRLLVFVAGLGLLAPGCSMKRLAVNKLGDALAAGGTTFAADDDPELVKAAVPFSLKLMESLLSESPEHQGLLSATARGFTQYGYAFVQQDADELEVVDLTRARELQHRARKLYVRARDYGLRGLDTQHRDFSRQLRENPRATVARARKADVPLLYWTAVSWAAAISLAKDDPQFVADLPQVEALIDRALVLDPNWEAGAIHSFLITFTMARASGEGHPVERARRHFDRAVALSNGRQAGPYVSLAEAVCIPQENRAEFEELLGQALAINPDADPANRLANLIMQRRAQWLRARVDKLFLPPLDPNS